MIFLPTNSSSNLLHPSNEGCRRFISTYNPLQEENGEEDDEEEEEDNDKAPASAPAPARASAAAAAEEEDKELSRSC